MRGLLLAVLCAVALAAAPAWAAPWQVDPARSRLGFSGTQAGAPFEGTFERFSASIDFDEANLASSTAVIVIGMKSARTGLAERDAAITGADWFAADRYPEARFETRGVRSLGGGRYEADAVLTIRDAARTVVLPFTLQPEDGATRALGELTIDRTQFGVGQGQWASPQWVGHPVIIRFDLLARPAR